MKKISSLINKAMAGFMVLVFAFASFGASGAKFAEAAAPNWNASGNYVINMEYLGTQYPHDMSLTQDNSGNLTGNGGSPAGANTYTWVITSGSVSGDAISFTADYTATADAVTPQTVLNVTGTIAPDGTISGTWSDNYQDGERTGAVSTVSGQAVAIPPASSSVTTNPATVITSTDATLNGTNASTAATQSSFWASTSTFSTAAPVLPPGVFSTPDLGPQAASAPFSAPLTSMSGMPAVTPSTTYYFAAWANVNGTWTPGAVLNFTTSATPVPGAPTVSSVSPSTGDSAGGTSVTITGTGFTGATAVNFGSNGATNVSVVNDTSITATSPAGTGIADVTVTTPNGTSAVNEGDQFTYGLVGGVNTPPGVLHVDSITSSPNNANGIADDNYAHGWTYTFHITAPTNEPNLSMKFADWLSGANVLPVASNMRISSAQASNGPITLTAANTYSAPLILTGDTAPATVGRQVDVVVEVKIPVGTANGSYSTSYGVQTN